MPKKAGKSADMVSNNAKNGYLMSGGKTASSNGKTGGAPPKNTSGKHGSGIIASAKAAK